MRQSSQSAGWVGGGTDLDAINGDVDGVEPHGPGSPVGAVGAVRVGPDQHVLTGPAEQSGTQVKP